MPIGFQSGKASIVGRNMQWFGGGMIPSVAQPSTVLNSSCGGYGNDGSSAAGGIIYSHTFQGSQPQSMSNAHSNQFSMTQMPSMTPGTGLHILASGVGGGSHFGGAQTPAMMAPHSHTQGHVSMRPAAASSFANY
jgi:hypothetical protein